MATKKENKYRDKIKLLGQQPSADKIGIKTCEKHLAKNDEKAKKTYL